MFGDNAQCFGNLKYLIAVSLSRLLLDNIPWFIICLGNLRRYSPSAQVAFHKALTRRWQSAGHVAVICSGVDLIRFCIRNGVQDCCPWYSGGP